MQLGQLSLLNAVAFVACSCMAFMLQVNCCLLVPMCSDLVYAIIQVMWFQKICIGAMKVPYLKMLA